MNKKLFRSILILIAFTLILVVCLIRLDSILGFIGMIFGVLTPVWIAVPLALILNQPYKFLNARFSELGAKIKSKREKKKEAKYAVVKGTENKKISLKRNKKKKHRTVSSVLALIITYVIFLFILVIILTFVAPQVFETVGKLLVNIRDYTNAIAEFVESIDSPLITRYIDTNEVTAVLQKVITSTLENALSYSQQIIAVTSNIVSQIINIGLGIIFSIYLILFKTEIKAAGSKLLRAYAPQKLTTVIKNTVRFSADVLANYLLDRVLKGMIITLLLFTGFNIAGMNYSLFIAVVAGICCLLPVFGAFIALLILALLVFLTNPAFLIFALIYSTVVITCTNLFIVKAITRNETIKLHPVVVIVSAFAGAVLYNFVGMLLSVPVAVIISYILPIILRWINNRTKKKENDTDQPEETAPPSEGEESPEDNENAENEQKEDNN